MARKRDDLNPIDAKRRLLAEQERLLAQKRRELTQQLESGGNPGAMGEPPVWRMEEEEHQDAKTEATPAGHRHLARQRRRDMLLFFTFIIVLAIVVVAVILLMHAHVGAMGHA